MKPLAFAAALVAANLSTTNAAPVASSTQREARAVAPVGTSVAQERICLRCWFGG